MKMRNIYSLESQGLRMPEQGTQEWLDGRKGRITGSKPSSLWFSFKQESDWDEILEDWFGDKKKEFDATSIKRMAWGSKHEDTAVNVIVDTIPNSHFFECPQININDVYAVSPDGALIVLEDDQETPKWHCNIEIKCPGRFSQDGKEQSPEKMKAYLMKKWKRPASYYMTQIHQEMVGQKVNETLFVVWTPLMTRMWKIKFDQEYWDLCLEVFENFRLKNVPFEVMYSKIDSLKGRSFGISNVPIWKDVHHESSI